MTSHSFSLLLAFGIGILGYLSIARKHLTRAPTARVLSQNGARVMVAPGKANIRKAPTAKLLVQSDKKMMVVGPHPIYNVQNDKAYMVQIDRSYNVQNDRSYNVQNDRSYNVQNGRSYNAISRRSLLRNLKSALKITVFGIGIFMIMLIRSFLISALGAITFKTFFL